MKNEFEEIGKGGEILLSSKGVLSCLYEGVELNTENFLVDNSNDVLLYNQFSSSHLDNHFYKLPNHEERKNQWFYPEELNSLDLKQFFYSLCKTDIEKERVDNELKVYTEKNFDKFLRYCIYLSYVITQNHLVIGCGRGSSCASYLLFLLGLHKVNPIEYNLDIYEFLK